MTIKTNSLIKIPEKSVSPTQLYHCAQDNNLSGVFYFLKNDNPNTPCEQGLRALDWAVLHNNATMVDSLLGAKAEILYNGFEHTPLFYAISQNNPETVKLLLNHKADPNTSQSSSSKSALILACQLGNANIVQSLLNERAQVFYRTQSGIDPFLAATNCGHFELAERFEERKYDKAYQALKIIGHAFSGRDEIALEGIFISMEGSSGLAKFYEHLANVVEKTPLPEGIKSAELHEALDACSRYATKEEILHRIHSGKLVFLEVGWKGHALQLVIRGKDLVLANRGERDDITECLTFYRIDTTKINLQLLEEIEIKKFEPFEVGTHYFYSTLIEKIATGGPIIHEPLHPKEQKSGNCGYSSITAGIRGALYLLNPSAELEKVRLAAKSISLHSAVRAFEEHFTVLEEYLPGLIAQNLKNKKEQKQRRFLSLTHS